MALDFPTSPANGQKYPQPPVVGQPVYTWDGEKWKAAGSGVIPTIMVSDSPPINPPDNALWWESDSGLLYLRYNDGDTSQWVIAAPQPDVTVFAPLASPVFTGDPQAPTPATADNDTSIATTAFVKAQLVSPALTGNPIAPTPAAGDNDTSIATTAFAQTEIAAKAVRYDAAQTLTTPQQTQARDNINAIAKTGDTMTGALKMVAPVAAADGATKSYVDQFVVTPDTSWKSYAYQNGWVDYGAPYSPTGYRKLSNGLVVLKGLVMNGTATTIFTLPVGYRPGNTLLFGVQTSPNVSCRIDISATGVVAHTGGSNGWISLAGITFFAEQ